jgi:ribose 5-phosphate isomerase B
MRIALGADHAGFDLKQHLSAVLRELGHEVEDLGTFDRQSTDYPDWAARVAARVADGAADRGLLVCGTGIGMAIAANRRHGVRAAPCNDLFTIQLARAHNDANVLALGARIVAPALAEAILARFLETPFEGGRHSRRVDKLDREPA